MRAIVQAGYSSADVLHLEEIGRPAAGDGEVLLRVNAAGLDRGTWHLLAGLPYLIRLVSGLRAPKDPVPGLDVACTVAAVGADVTGFAVGEEVFGIGQGSFRRVHARRLGRLGPERLNRRGSAWVMSRRTVRAARAPASSWPQRACSLALSSAVRGSVLSGVAVTAEIEASVSIASMAANRKSAMACHGSPSARARSPRAARASRPGAATVCSIW
jgi:hypothetical protein